jgi:F0F1-type ATP synthase membrane subunit b/b'
MTEQEQLTQLCQRLGATAAQASVMAAQLLKRAEQLATERKSSRETELKRLLELLTKGHSGEVPKDFVPPPPRLAE